MVLMKEDINTLSEEAKKFLASNPSFTNKIEAF